MGRKFSADKVVIVGQGYVGLPLSMAASSAGYSVVGIDNNQSKVESLARGISHIEDVSDSELGTFVAHGAYKATSDFREAKDFSIAVITVPTPLFENQPDLSFIEQAAASIGKFVTAGSLVVLESTTYPGTTEELLVPALEAASGLMAGHDFHVAYSPERIDPGNKEWGLLTTPKVVSGINRESSQLATLFYSKLGIPVIEVSGTREAELTKLLENTFRHVNIALVNELAMFADKLNVDIWEAIEAAATKPFGFMKFFPGPGVGGHCLPVDPSYLSWAIEEASGETFEFVALANRVNRRMPSYIVERLRKMAKSASLSGLKVLVVGIAYKPNTGDTRESPALEIARQLQSAGAEVVGIDPHVKQIDWPVGVERTTSLENGSYDIAVIVTPHDVVEFEKLALLNIPVLDTRNSTTGANIVAL